MGKAYQIAFLFYVMLLEGAKLYILRKCLVYDDGCWLWVGCNDGRYGHAWYMGQRFKAHRLAYLAWRGGIPPKKVLDHEVCDRTNCCNPFHVEVVTQKKNIMRCFQIGRGRSPFLMGSAHD
jgi:hypothetical protein